MSMNPFTGPIMYVGRITVDDRIITKVTIARFPIQVVRLAFPYTEDGPPDHQLLGYIDEVAFTPGGAVHASGLVDLPPGNYGCGVDMRLDSSTVADSLRMSGALLGLTVYARQSQTQPAWPDAHITVTKAT